MICIRKTDETDCPAVTELINRAFRDVRHSEYLSLTEMCGSGYFYPELSLVAEVGDHVIVGHIYLIEILIGYTYPSLGLVQVAVVPEFQGLGIGSLLVENAHQIAKELGYGSIISLGGKSFLRRFGYQSLSDFDIHYPCGIIKDGCFALELHPGALSKTHGKVAFPMEYL